MYIVEQCECKIANNVGNHFISLFLRVRKLLQPNFRAHFCSPHFILVYVVNVLIGIPIYYMKLDNVALAQLCTCIEHQQQDFVPFSSS